MARDRLPKTDWEDGTLAITSAVTRHPWFVQAETIYCYVNFGSEVGTRDLISRALLDGKHVAVPKIQPGTSQPDMEFYYIRSLDELHEGAFHILEPAPLNQADGKEGLVIMPGVVFDRTLSRIGYGKGYYDHYLREHSNLFTMAVAFSLQCEEAVPSESHDIRPMVLVTEKGIFSTGQDTEID